MICNTPNCSILDHSMHCERANSQRRATLQHSLPTFQPHRQVSRNTASSHSVLSCPRRRASGRSSSPAHCHS
eukprot:340543-Lingulodinium_polyedra.AAC.1